MDALTNCSRHTHYPDKATAEASLRAMKRRIRARGENIKGHPEAYRCKTCGHWSIGRRNGRRGR